MSDSDSRAPVPVTAPTAETCVRCGKPILDGERAAISARDGLIHERCAKIGKMVGLEITEADLPPELRSSSAPSPGAEDGERPTLGRNERVARHLNGHLVIEQLPLPTQEQFDAKFRSLAKAWPVLAKHADAIDGEFDNALRDVRRMVERLLAAVPAPGEERTGTAEADEARYQALLAQKLEWLRENAIADARRFGDVPAAQLDDALANLLHFLPAGSEWAVNVARHRLASSAASAPVGEPTAGGTTATTEPKLSEKARRWEQRDERAGSARIRNDRWTKLVAGIESLEAENAALSARLVDSETKRFRLRARVSQLDGAIRSLAERGLVSQTEINDALDAALRLSGAARTEDRNDG